MAMGLLVASSAVAQGRLPQCAAATSVPWNNCEGALTMPNGDKYVGEFRNGKPNGQGIISWANGNKYVGAISDGKMNGKGTLTWADGSISVGEFNDGQPASSTASAYWALIANFHPVITRDIWDNFPARRYASGLVKSGNKRATKLTAGERTLAVPCLKTAIA
jgi:hypothetical protein